MTLTRTVRVCLFHRSSTATNDSQGSHRDMQRRSQPKPPAATSSRLPRQDEPLPCERECTPPCSSLSLSKSTPAVKVATAPPCLLATRALLRCCPPAWPRVSLAPLPRAHFAAARATAAQAALPAVGGVHLSLLHESVGAVAVGLLLDMSLLYTRIYRTLDLAINHAAQILQQDFCFLEIPEI